MFRNQDGDWLADMSRRCILQRRTGPLMLLGMSAGSVDGVAEDSAKFTDERDLAWASSEWLSRLGLGLHSSAYI